VILVTRRGQLGLDWHLLDRGHGKRSPDKQVVNAARAKGKELTHEATATDNSISPSLMITVDDVVLYGTHAYKTHVCEYRDEDGGISLRLAMNKQKVTRTIKTRTRRVNSVVPRSTPRNVEQEGC
jgi:hypothetical protein